ncbi:hypothetical protein D3C76_1018370 [compost metagenome]
MHKLDDAYWMAVDYFDLLKGYIRYKNVTNDVSVEGALMDLNITPSGSAHRALDDARMTSEVLRAIIDKLDFEYTQQFKDVYSNAKERRMVKNAIRSMTSQKIPLIWDNLYERFLKEKVSLEDPRKFKELQQYFISELTKDKQPVAGGVK